MDNLKKERKDRAAEKKARKLDRMNKSSEKFEFNPQLPRLADIKDNLSQTIIQPDLINTILKYYEPSIEIEYYTVDKTSTLTSYFTKKEFDPKIRRLANGMGGSNFKNVKNMEICGILELVDPRDLFLSSEIHNIKGNVILIGDASGMLQNTVKFNSDIVSWDTSLVTDMSYMFRSSSFNQSLKKWNTSQVKDMKYMFCGAEMFKGNISRWNTSKVENMSYMFYEALQFNRDISRWDTSKVEDMQYMFAYASQFNKDISKWNTSEVVNMSRMFCNASQFNQDISEWNTSKVDRMDHMFEEAIQFDQDISGWDTSKVIIFDRMFYRARNFKGASNGSLEGVLKIGYP
jgi:surface protein